MSGSIRRSHNQKCRALRSSESQTDRVGSRTLILLMTPSLKAQVNEDTSLPTQMFLCLPARATFVADTNFVSGIQKMFLILFRNILSATNVFQFAQPRKHHGQQCVRNNVSSFTRALRSSENCIIAVASRSGKINQRQCSTPGFAIGWFFRFCFRLRQPSFHLIILKGDGLVNGIR